MLNRQDHLELLSLIEGELDASQTAALRHRLANEPRVLALLDRIADDRSNLRSIPEPILPRDFLTDLEPILARSMLIETGDLAEPMPASAPGHWGYDWRRQYRKQTRRIRWPRLAAAAVVLLCVIAGTWAAFNGLLTIPDANPTLVANNELATGTPDVVAEANDVAGVVHHYMPSVAATYAHRDAAVVTSNRSGDRPVVASFAIVVQSTSDKAAAEAGLGDSAIAVSSQVALVRNFSFEEGRKLAEEWLMAQGPQADRRPSHIASTQGDAGELQEIADSVRRQMASDRTRTRRSSASADASGQLVGLTENAPTLEQQLDFSSRGATHTLAIPAAGLNALLEQLAMSPGQTTTLRLLPADVKQPLSHDGVHSLSGWLMEAPHIRQSVQQLSQLHPETIVYVPLVLKSAE